MKLAIGLLFIVVGLVGGYFILSGKFPPSTTNTSTNTTTASTNKSSATGDGSISLQGYFSHLGVPTFSEHNDMTAVRLHY